MAPETLNCLGKSKPEENKTDERFTCGRGVDVWATGILTYELLVSEVCLYFGAASSDFEAVLPH